MHFDLRGIDHSAAQRRSKPSCALTVDVRSDQASIFPSLSSKLDTFYSGMSLAELAQLAQSAGLQAEIAYADALNLDSFRARLKANLERPGDFVIVNYDRRVLKQAGAGHISADSCVRSVS